MIGRSNIVPIKILDIFLEKPKKKILDISKTYIERIEFSNSPRIFENEKIEYSSQLLITNYKATKSMVWGIISGSMVSVDRTEFRNKLTGVLLFDQIP